MAGDGGRQSGSLREQLYDNASRFSFLQAVRLLEQMRRGATPPGEGVSPRHEVVLFRHAVRFDFPETDVEAIIPPEHPDQPPQMTVNVLGLTGAFGPLPHHVSELVLERTLRGDDASRDFLDIFNHRLISLLYRARKKYRPALDPRDPHRGRVATVLFALMGLGTDNVRNRFVRVDPKRKRRVGVEDRTLLAYAGFLVPQHRSAIGLERLIAGCFGVPAKVVPFQGAWQDITEDDRTCIGVTGRNQLLGRGALVGRRIWDQAAGFELRLGPLSGGQFRSFLPNGHAHEALLSLVRFYAGEDLGFTVRLVLRNDRVPSTLLRRRARSYLGLMSWLKTRPSDTDDSQVTFVGRR